MPACHVGYVQKEGHPGLDCSFYLKVSPFGNDFLFFKLVFSDIPLKVSYLVKLIFLRTSFLTCKLQIDFYQRSQQTTSTAKGLKKNKLLEIHGGQWLGLSTAVGPDLFPQTTRRSKKIVYLRIVTTVSRFKLLLHLAPGSSALLGSHSPSVQSGNIRQLLENSTECERGPGRVRRCYRCV